MFESKTKLVAKFRQLWRDRQHENQVAGRNRVVPNHPRSIRNRPILAG
jgi:hypothetical protein